MAASLSCWTACSNEDDDPVDEPEDPEEFFEETEPLTRQDSLDIAFMNVVSTQCQTDSTLYEQSGATAIRSATATTKQSDTIYSLNGTRHNAMQKGVNIINGRKIITK